MLCRQVNIDRKPTLMPQQAYRTRSVDTSSESAIDYNEMYHNNNIDQCLVC